MKKLLTIIFLLCFAVSAWGASYTVCSSGCDGTVANFEAGDSPFDDLVSDTVTFTDATQSDELRPPDSFGTQESERATLIFTGVTITDDADACLQIGTGAYSVDFVTIQGGTWVGGNGTEACVELYDGDGITLNGVTINPGSSDRGIRVYGGNDYFVLTNSTLDGGSNTSANLLHFYITAGTTVSNFTIGGSGNGNTFVDSGARSIDFSITGSGYAHTGEISYNTITDGDNQGIRILPDAIDGGECYGIDIKYNTIHDTGNDGIAVTRATSTGGTFYIRNNTLTDISVTANNSTVNGIRVGASSGVVVEDNTIDNVDSTSGDGNGIIIDKATIGTTLGSDGIIVRRNLITNCLEIGGAGISNYQSDNSKIYSNVSYGNLKGINYGEDSGSDEQSSGGLIHNNTLTGNSEYGGRIRENALGSTWTNNIAYNNTTQDLIVEAGGTAPTTSYNLAVNRSNWTAGTGAVSGDPLFVSSTNFHLKSTSPAINAGTDLGSPYNIDYDGRDRDDHGLWDIGAYEYATYYLRESGTNADSDCSESSACCAGAMDMSDYNAASFYAGDTIYVCDDDGVFRSQLVPPSSGSAGSPITTIKYPGDTPVISTASVETTWTLTQAAIYEKAFGSTTLSLTEDAMFLTWIVWDTDVTTTFSGASAGSWTVDGADKVYVWCTDSLDPDTHTMEVQNVAAVTENCVLIRDVSYNTIDGLTLRGGYRGVLIDHTSGNDANNNIIQNCDIAFSGYNGIDLNNWADKDASKPINSTTIQNNTVRYNRQHGIVQFYDVKNTLIKNNTVYNNGWDLSAGWHGISTWSNDADSYVSGCIVEKNIVYNQYAAANGAEGNGIQMDDYTVDCIIRDNKVYDNEGSGLVDHSIVADGSLWHNNLIYNNGTDSTDAGIKIINSDTAEFSNNTVTGNYYGLVNMSASASTVIKNNIIYENTNQEAVFDVGAVTSIDMDYNVVYHSAGGTFMDWGGTDYNWADWKTNSSQDANSLNTDPLFVSSTNFHLKHGSPAIDKGTLVSILQQGWQDIYGVKRLCGDGPDIGASEYCKASSFPPVIFDDNTSKVADWYSYAESQTGHYLLIDGAGHYLLIDGSTNKLRIDGYFQ